MQVEPDPFRHILRAGGKGQAVPADVSLPHGFLKLRRVCFASA